MILLGTPRVARIHAGKMESAVIEAVEAMTWLRPSDQAMVELAVTYAQQVDQAGADQRAIGYLGQQLHACLKALGGTPGERKALNTEVEANGKLAELRKARAARVRGAAGLDSSSS